MAAHCMLLHDLHGLTPKFYCYLVSVSSVHVCVCVWASRSSRRLASPTILAVSAAWCVKRV